MLHKALDDEDRTKKNPSEESYILGQRVSI